MKKEDPKGQSTAPADYGQLGTVLAAAFALALCLESALHALFNWRPFVETFVRGTRTVISFGVSLVLVNTSPKLDLFAQLVTALYPGTSIDGVFSAVLSAMLLAGGSSGINTLMVGLGIRSPRTPESITPKPHAQEAWVAVRVVRTSAQESVAAVPSLWVRMKVDDGEQQIIGTVEARSPQNALLRYFLRDRGRVPTAGGFSVVPGRRYTFDLIDGQQTPMADAAWGPQVIGDRAIVNITFRVP